MPNKIIKFILQAEPSAQQDVNVVITVDSVPVFDSPVPTVGPVELDVPDPNESFTFDLDVAAAANVLATGWPVVLATETRNFSISATNGTAKIENIRANFTATGNLVGNVFTFVPGSADSFETCNIIGQPTWNGEVDLIRYNIEYNNGPIQVTGPGEVLIEPGETVVFDVAVPAFNDSAPPV